MSEYLQKFEGDLSAFLSTCGSEEETMEKINQIHDILCIMDADMSKESKPTKTEANEQKQEIKNEKLEIQMKQEDESDTKKNKTVLLLRTV